MSVNGSPERNRRTLRASISCESIADQEKPAISPKTPPNRPRVLKSWQVICFRPSRISSVSWNQNCATPEVGVQRLGMQKDK